MKQNEPEVIEFFSFYNKKRREERIYSNLYSTTSNKNKFISDIRPLFKNI